MEKQLMRSVTIFALCLTLHASFATGGVSLSLKGPATVWNREITITGTATSSATHGILYVQGYGVPFSLTDSSFSVPVRLDEGTAVIVARVDSGGVAVYSDTLRLTLGFNIRPECFAYATSSGNNATLHASIIDNPDSQSLTFLWLPRLTNPGPLTLSSPNDSTASFSLPGGSPQGEYYFDLTVTSPSGDSVHASTIVTLDSTGLRAFDIKTDHARWIDSAVIYGVSPYMFVPNTRFVDITLKIPELAGLGVTALWIQPIYVTTDPDQGYAILDYFNFRPELGNEPDLRTLVTTAHQYGVRVLLDFVPNHISGAHPYAQDAIQKGERSYYYDFFQHDVNDGARYSADYRSRTEGLMQFVYYRFLPTEMVNLNYNNPDVQRWIIEATRYWIEKFDVDGYRIDAVWGVTARTPEFTKQWRSALKRIKPEVLLLAEDKAKYPPVFDERFDAAYDWAPDEGWVSHWNWQPTYSGNSNPTIFNTPDPNVRAGLLRNALTGFPSNAKVLHFVENNDTYRFLPTHDLSRTTMAGAMLFSLPGIPLLFNGQEIGVKEHPYSAIPMFSGTASIQSRDRYGLFTFYKNMIAMRKRFPAFISENFAEVTVSPSTTVFAYRRWAGSQNIFPVLNMGPAAATVQMQLPVAALALDSTRTYYLTDYFTGQTFSGTRQTLALLSMSVNAYTARILLLDTIAIASGIETPNGSDVPKELTLAQNYPNPFNPKTGVRFQVSGVSDVKIAVYDILGREVAVLVNERKTPGSYEVTFDGRGLASGVYIYRMSAGTFVQTRKMLLLK
jgi:cyclomaltodextrinase / maltogenic alpha-amylase / neopullulanase